MTGVRGVVAHQWYLPARKSNRLTDEMSGYETPIIRVKGVYLMAKMKDISTHKDLHIYGFRTPNKKGSSL